MDGAELVRNMMKPATTEYGARLAPLQTVIKVVVFDCDGVLLDSKSANVHFYDHILARFNRHKVRADQQEYVHMHSAQESLRYLLGDGEVFEEAWSYCQRMDFRQFHAFLRTEPGLVPFLRALQPCYRIALATNRTVSTQEVLSHFLLDQYFDQVVTAADVAFPKPHPESMERILEHFSASAEEVLYIGDSQVDEALAMATRVVFVAYKNPQLRAHMHIDHFEQLYPVLLSHSAPKA
jgi:phosphoglycolate phosphatase